MKLVILYHANCFDGLHAAAVAHAALGDEAEYHAVNYENPKTDFSESDIVFLDVVYKAPEMQQLLDQGNRIIIVDHHHDNLKGIEHLGIETFKTEGESGASLAWQFFNGEAQMPLAVQHAKDYDLWTFSLDNTNAFVAQQGTLPMDIPTYKALQSLAGEEYDAFVAKGQSILTYKNSIVAAMASRAVPVKLMGFSGHVVNGPYELASEIGNQICNERGGDFAIVWFQQENGKAKLSLRSNDGSAPQQIAKKLFGGGGHERASGAHCEMGKLMQILEAGQDVYKKPQQDAVPACGCDH